MYRQILVPLDGSELAKTTLPPAGELAKALGAAITVLIVVEPCESYPWLCDPYGTASPVIVEEIEAGEKERMGRANEYVERIVEDMKAQGVSDAELVLNPGQSGSDSPPTTSLSGTC